MKKTTKQMVVALLAEMDIFPGGGTVYSDLRSLNRKPVRRINFRHGRVTNTTLKALRSLPWVKKAVNELYAGCVDRLLIYVDEKRVREAYRIMTAEDIKPSKAQVTMLAGEITLAMSRLYHLNSRAKMQVLDAAYDRVISQL